MNKYISKFCDVSVGSKFYVDDNDNVGYMKVDTASYNAVNLNTGEMLYLHGSTIVYVIENLRTMPELEEIPLVDCNIGERIKICGDLYLVTNLGTRYSMAVVKLSGGEISWYSKRELVKRL